jgi:hypothetical protein
VGRAPRPSPRAASAGPAAPPPRAIGAWRP